jgi:hypothetical protein
MSCKKPGGASRAKRTKGRRRKHHIHAYIQQKKHGEKQFKGSNSREAEIEGGRGKSTATQLIHTAYASPSTHVSLLLISAAWPH